MQAFYKLLFICRVVTMYTLCHKHNLTLSQNAITTLLLTCPWIIYTVNVVSEIIHATIYEHFCKNQEVYLQCSEIQGYTYFIRLPSTYHQKILSVSPSKMSFY